MKNKYAVSVVIPVYNGEKHLEECIESLVTQTIFNKMEIVIVNDGSTDGSQNICSAYSKRYENIKIINQKNAGVSVARNMGIKSSLGEFIGFVDADDYVYTEMYERLYLNSITTGAEISACGFKHNYPDRDVIISDPFEKNKLLDGKYIKEVVAPFMLSDSSFNSLCNKIFSRKIIEENAIELRAGKKFGEDREFLLRAMQKSKGICCTDYVGYYYRRVETSAVQKPRDDYTKTIFEQYRLDFELFEALGVERQNIERLNSVSTMKQIINAMTSSEDKFKGKEKRKVMNDIMNNADVQELISNSDKKNAEVMSNFNSLILKMMKKKSIVGVRAVILAMKVKIRMIRK